MKNLWRDQKPRAYYRLKTSTMKNKNWSNTRFYLTQANQSFPNHLTSTFTFKFSPSSSIDTWSLHQARSRPLLEFTQEENGFLQKTKRMRVECFRNQPMFIFKKSFKSNSWKTYGIFLGGKHPQNGKERKTLSQLL